MSQHGPSGPEPEYLSSGDPTSPREKSGGSGPRLALIAGGAIALAGLVGGALWAWAAFSSAGPQPAEALPEDTLGYAAVDLDPSAQQGIEAIRTIRTFPALREQLDIGEGDDLRQRILEEALADSDCDLDYGDDIEPWLGKRFAIAAVPGDGQPDPVFVLQVTDGDAADEGLTAIRDCGDGGEDGAWEIRGEWALIAETADIAEKTADAATESSLADDDDFTTWTDAAGDPGIVSAYAAPSAGPALGELIAGQSDLGVDELGSGGLTPEGVLPDDSASGGPVPPQVGDALESFGGAAMAVRFDDGALEVEVATAATEELDYASEEGNDVVSTLPEDTAVAFGLAFTEGWGEAALDNIEEQFGPEVGDAISFFEAQLGLELPDDLETVVGESMAFSLGSEFDVDALAESPDGSDLPVGAKIRGDAEGIEDVLDKLQAAVGPGGEQILGTDSEGDVVAVGPNEDYREDLLADGGLGESDVYGDVIQEADRATVVLFLNFDANGWLDDAVRAQGDDETAENIEPLEAAGLSAWQDAEENHVLFRLTTE